MSLILRIVVAIAMLVVMGYVLMFTADYWVGP